MFQLIQEAMRSGEQAAKALFALICLAVEAVLAFLLAWGIFGYFFNQWGDSIFWTTIIIWCWLISVTINSFLVSVPEVTGLITVNAITGNMATYGSGLHFRFPWEQVKEGNYINLRLITQQVTETYPSQDGPSMLTKWSYQYRPRLEALPTYISSDDETIKEGLKDLGSSVLSAEIARTPSAECKSRQEEIQDTLVEKFEEAEPPPETLYGIDIVVVALADVDYEPEVQKVKAAQVVATTLKGIAEDLRSTHPDSISGKDALNAAMIINKDITKHVVEVEGEGGNALAGLVVAALQGGKKGGK